MNEEIWEKASRTKTAMEELRKQIEKIDRIISDKKILCEIRATSGMMNSPIQINDRAGVQKLLKAKRELLGLELMNLEKEFNEI